MIQAQSGDTHKLTNVTNSPVIMFDGKVDFAGRRPRGFRERLN